MTNRIRRVASLALLLTLALFAGASPQAGSRLRLGPGDVIVVTVSNLKNYGGECTVFSDGSISGLGFSRVMAEGKTLEEVRTSIRAALAKTLKDPRVEVVLKTERPKFVYFVGSLTTSGVVPWTPDLTLQNALSGLKVEADPDLVELTLYRGKQKPQRLNYQALLRGDESGVPGGLLPNDLISVLPAKEIRVWVLGHVGKTGELKVREGTDIYEAIAQAGGLEKGTALDSEIRLTLRRGDDRQTFPAQPKPNGNKVVLEAGDTLYVEAPNLIHVTVAGEVVQPGEVTVREGSPVSAGIAAARGRATAGTLENVMVFRNGQVQVVDATAGLPDAAVGLQENDLVVVQRSQKIVYALGGVTNAGPVVIPDGRQYRASDVLADAHGVNSQGTLRRVVLVRPDKNGKLAIKQQFNLDEFLKDGKQDANPVVQPGDVLFFGSPRANTASTILQAVSAGLLFNSLFKR